MHGADDFTTLHFYSQVNSVSVCGPRVDEYSYLQQKARVPNFVLLTLLLTCLKQPWPRSINFVHCTWIRLRHEKTDGGQDGGQPEARLPVSLELKKLTSHSRECQAVRAAVLAQR